MRRVPPRNSGICLVDAILKSETLLKELVLRLILLGRQREALDELELCVALFREP
jgi:hypothetical protein